jgi:hypothetical protein
MKLPLMVSNTASSPQKISTTKQTNSHQKRNSQKSFINNILSREFLLSAQKLFNRKKLDFGFCKEK